jgi:uncharacterized protein (TIGR02145 family)
MKNRIRFCLLMAVVLASILTNSCKKEEETSAIKDGDGNVYTSVTIGTQVWMVGNLKTTKYLNGDLIGTTNPAVLDISGESSPKYHWACNNNESNVMIYGRLYSWHAVTDSRGICPASWHVPSDAEWTTLTTFLGGESVAGGKLKEQGTAHWTTPNTGATDEYGFKAVPGGDRDPSSGFWSFGTSGMWWSTTEYNANTVHCRALNYNASSVENYDGNKKSGFSVRCVKD